MRTMNTVGLALALMLAAAATASAQPVVPPAPAPAPAAPRTMLEGAAGWAGFGDEGIIHHALIGAAWRGYVTRRLSLGPEVQFMAGPGFDRDLILTGNVMLDLLPRTADRPRRTTPYVLLGGGLFRHTDRFLTGTSTSTEGAFTLGAGMRTWVSERVYVAADARLGWEPHVRVAALVGVALQ